MVISLCGESGRHQVEVAFPMNCSILLLRERNQSTNLPESVHQHRFTAANCRR